MADEGFREIQLDGKQLIALFMTAAVALVVTFLCGVLVGRGVRAQKEPAIVGSEVLPPSSTPTADPTGPAAAAAAAVAAKSQPSTPAATPTTAPPSPPPDDELSYYNRLDSATPPAEDQKAAGAKAAAAKAAEAPAVPAAKPAAPPPAKPAEEAADAADAAGGWVVKAAAYKDKTTADALAARLAGKGFASFVVQLKAAGLYSVRVGKFKTRKDAEAAKRRLEKEESLKSLLISR